MYSTPFEIGYARSRLDAYFTEGWVITQFLATGFTRKAGSKAVTWEPACGTGRMAYVLGKFGHNVYSTDITSYGYAGQDDTVDFTKCVVAPVGCDFIMTNPPYEVRDVFDRVALDGEMFVRHALALMKPRKGKVAMLLRNEFDSAVTRSDLFARGPFVAKFVLTSRPAWFSRKDHPTGKTGASGPRHNYAWFYWDWGADPATTGSGNARTFYLPVDTPSKSFL